jgi:hypothetical protein
VGIEIGARNRNPGDNDRVYKYVFNAVNNSTTGAGVDLQILAIPTAPSSYTSDGTARNRMTIRYDGNVGIGTANPTFGNAGVQASPQTTIWGACQPTATAINTTGNLGGCLCLVDTQGQQYSGGALLFGAPQGVWGAIKGSLQNGSSNTAGDIVIATRNAVTDPTLTTRMTITSGGNVGIGTPSPATVLSVQGGAASGRVDVYGDVIEIGAGRTADGAAFIDLHAADGTYGDYAARINRLSGPNGSLAFYLRGTGEMQFVNQEAAGMVWYTSGAERMRMGTAGGIIIGGSGGQPSYPLHVVGQAYTTDTIYVGTTNTDPTLGRVNGTNVRSDGRLFTRGAGHSCGIDSTSGTQIQFWTDNGSSRVACGAITSSGSSTSYTGTSDYRLKENVQPITMAMDVIARLRPVTYTWKADGTPGQGFIAHELQEVIPECVIGEKDAIDSEGNIKPQGVDKTYIISYIVASVQELSTENTALKTQLAAMDARLALLESKLAA